jgi:hypothetical protein
LANPEFETAPTSASGHYQPLIVSPRQGPLTAMSGRSVKHFSAAMSGRSVKHFSESQTSLYGQINRFPCHHRITATLYDPLRYSKAAWHPSSNRS